jgi:hypothetical protein
MRKEVAKFVKECHVCERKKKPEHVNYLGLLQPLAVPDMAWTRISMHFVEGLPFSGNKDLILVQWTNSAPPHPDHPVRSDDSGMVQ